MEATADRYWASFLIMREGLEQEFEQRLPEAAVLAFRVAYGVLRNREDAEDVAQEAMAKAYRSFESLEDRERFRSWLVRMAWRMALDRQRSARRRARREEGGAEVFAPRPNVEEI